MKINTNKTVSGCEVDRDREQIERQRERDSKRKDLNRNWAYKWHFLFVKNK